MRRNWYFTLPVVIAALAWPLAITTPSNAGAAPDPSTAGAPPAPSTAESPPPHRADDGMPALAKPTGAEIAAARVRVVDLNRKLRAISAYVRRNRDNSETIRTDKARAAGFSAPMVGLAAELVAYQNALLRRARNLTDRNGFLPSVALADYPHVRSLFTQATIAALKQLRAQQAGRTPTGALDLTAQPCGDWLHPIPSANPPKQMQGPFSDVKAMLRQHGYHPTAGYACGRSEERICAGDYTRGHRMVTAAGVCSPPRFRDQATASSSFPHYVRVQYGEPNPETADYTWPYWTWGAYVVWWHRNY